MKRNSLILIICMLLVMIISMADKIDKLDRTQIQMKEQLNEFFRQTTLEENGDYYINADIVVYDYKQTKEEWEEYVSKNSKFQIK